MTQILFITGTDTDVGKTFISVALLLGFRRNHTRVAYWKPVQSGPPDSDLVASLVGDRIPILPAIHSYPTPASPNHAAAIDGMPELSLEDLCQRLDDIVRDSDDFDLLVIEGAGGLHVPLNAQHQTWTDFLAHRPIPIVVVSRSGLGTINHTSLMLESMRLYDIDCLAVILNGAPHERNRDSLKIMHPDTNFLCFDYYAERDDVFLNQASSLAAAVSTQLQQFTAARSAEGATITAADQRYCWHPYTQHQTASPPIPITRARGVWLHAADQKRLLDGTSSWWVNTIGHGRREIATAIARQQRRLDHTMFAGLTHQPATRLAQRLADWTGLSRVFYSDNGSTAVEVALKIAYQSWVNRGETNRRSFLALNGNYHGDTFGCMSIAATSGFHDAFGPLLFQAKYLNPCTRHPSSIGQTDVGSSIASMKQYLAEHASTLAAIIIEPLVQGAGGMLMHDLGWLKALCLEARSLDIPVIFDEVFVGFGRLGTWFAFEQINFKPDILCLAKGLTGGNLALAVTLTSEAFFEHFLSDAKSKALLHGHSYTANPIACAAALATCNIYASEGILENVKQLEHCYVEWLEAYPTLLSHPRIHGSILAGEFPGSGTGDYFKNTHSGYSKSCLDKGLYVRPLGNTAYLVPPLVINHAETQHMLAAFGAALAAK